MFAAAKRFINVLLFALFPHRRQIPSPLFFPSMLDGRRLTVVAGLKDWPRLKSFFSDRGITLGAIRHLLDLAEGFAVLVTWGGGGYSRLVGCFWIWRS